jgi:hypothetical protein
MPAPDRHVIVDHLAHNHLPAIPAAFADAAIAAIEACDAGAPERRISYGEGLTANGRSDDSAAEICDAMHLWDLVIDPETAALLDEMGVAG